MFRLNAPDNNQWGYEMTGKKVWLITGAGRGLGLHLAQAALAAGHIVIATGRDPLKVAAATGTSNERVVLKLDVTHPEDANRVVEAAVEKFGRIDVLVNNSGNLYSGFFEELTPEQIRRQLETVLFGPMNVTRAVLPVMRKQRSGLVVTISSTAGIIGSSFCTAYAAGKFGVEGWMESLAPEIAPFGINTMLVEPGFFRTEFLGADSTTFATSVFEDYAARCQETVSALSSMNGKQPGDPAKLAAAVVQLAGRSTPPLRFAGGVDAVQGFEAKAKLLLEQANAHRTLSSTMGYPES